MRLSHIALIALLGASVALPVYAQPGPGGGPGPGRGAGVSPGPGKGPVSKRPRFQFNRDNTYGWGLMSAEERTAHRSKMLSAKTYDECKTVQDEHHKLMETRASEKGTTLRTPRQYACDRMKARGLLK